METIAGLGMETAVGVGETAVGESVGTVGAETMAEFSISGLSSTHFQMSLNGSAFATELNISKINSVFFIVFFFILKGLTAVGESVGTVGAETMAEFSSAFGETMSASVDSLSGYGTDLSGYGTSVIGRSARAP
jgi:hypothetical protein